MVSSLHVAVQRRAVRPTEPPYVDIIRRVNTLHVHLFRVYNVLQMSMQVLGWPLGGGRDRAQGARGTGNTARANWGTRLPGRPSRLGPCPGAAHTTHGLGATRCTSAAYRVMRRAMGGFGCTAVTYLSRPRMVLHVWLPLGMGQGRGKGGTGDWGQGQGRTGHKTRVGPRLPLRIPPGSGARTTRRRA